ncbi:MAG: ATP-binding protein [Methanomicrobiales archaeon]|nr:ATP-binding protein [Methanomicrobiales archaeon]
MRSNTGNAEILEERISQIETELASLRDENARLKEAHVECRSVEDIDAKERLRLFDVLETLPIYICLLSEDYHIPFANRYFRETFGESHGHPCYKFLFNRTEPCETCETYTVMKTRKPHHWFWTGPNRRDYDIYDFPFTDSDGTFLILEMGIDITDRNIAEKKLKQTLDTLEARVADRTRELETYYAKLQTEMEEHSKTDMALRETGQYLDNLIKYANAPIIVWDPQLRITRFNKAFEELTGREASEAIGQSLEFLFPKEKTNTAMDLVRKTMGGELWHVVEIPILHADGTVKTVLWNSATLYENDGKTVRSVIAQGQDITERRQAEEEVQEHMANLKRSNEDLERFAYIASHDLQEPLRNVVSFSQLLSRRYAGKLDPDADEFISYIVEGGKRMQSLISDLLDYSRVNTRAKPFEPTNCEDVVEKVMQNLFFVIQESNATIETTPLPVLNADPTQLEMVFQNLISNAIKFRRDEPPFIHISAERSGDIWTFAVRDNGIGIDPAFQERIFEIFQRLHTRDKYPGTGVGLAIVKKIIERHGGRIWVESEEGKGSTFYFTLPASS